MKDHDAVSECFVFRALASGRPFHALIYFKQITAPSWCRRHRTCHNRTLPHKPIVFIVNSKFHGMKSLYSEDFSRHKNVIIFTVT